MNRKPEIVIGIDPAARDGDWTTECEVEYAPDGTVKVLNIRKFRKTIDGDPITSSHWEPTHDPQT